VGVRIGFAENGGDPVDQLIGGGVLEAFGLVVNAVPGVAERIDEKCLDNAVSADHADGVVPPFGGEAGAVIADVFDEALVGESLEHAGDGARCDAESFRDGGCRDRPAILRELEDGLEIIFDGV
jgi:hypothetical protein